MTSSAAIRDHLRQVLAFPDLPLREARPTLFLLEAKAAAHYWRGFGALVPRELGFLRREHRKAEDAVNKALNYGYGLLRGHVWLAARRAGLDPSIGLLHTGRKRSAGLVFDLIEPFRQPIVDKAVLGLIGRGASLATNQAGQLTLRTRAMLARALTRRLARPATRRGQLMHRERRTLAFRRSLVERAPYEAFRMTW